MARCDGTTPGLAAAADREFLDFLLAESLMACAASPSPRLLNWRRSPVPSLRYLELMLTERCNLRCRHCYLGEVGDQELPLAAVVQTLEEFQKMQGLRVLLSWGWAAALQSLAGIKRAFAGVRTAPGAAKQRFTVD